MSLSTVKTGASREKECTTGLRADGMVVVVVVVAREHTVDSLKGHAAKECFCRELSAFTYCRQRVWNFISFRYFVRFNYNYNK